MTEPTRYRVEFSRRASKDVEEIGDHLAALRGADEAVRLIDAIVEHVASLEHFPHRGSIPQELGKLGRYEFRQLLSGRYRLIYHVDQDRVSVLLVADGRRDMQALVAERLLSRDPAP